MEREILLCHGKRDFIVHSSSYPIFSYMNKTCWFIIILSYVPLQLSNMILFYDYYHVFSTPIGQYPVTWSWITIIFTPHWSISCNMIMNIYHIPSPLVSILSHDHEYLSYSLPIGQYPVTWSWISIIFSRHWSVSGHMIMNIYHILSPLSLSEIKCHITVKYEFLHGEF